MVDSTNRTEGMNRWLNCPECGSKGDDTYAVFYPRYGEPHVEIEFVCLICETYEQEKWRSHSKDSEGNNQ